MSNCLATSLGRPTLCSSLAKLQCQLFALLGTFVLQVFLDLADPISKAFVFRFGRASQLSTGPQGKPFPFSQCLGSTTQQQEITSRVCVGALVTGLLEMP